MEVLKKLGEAGQQPDVVYVDPMFAGTGGHRKKKHTAAPKRDMQYLQAISGTSSLDATLDDFVTAAFTLAHARRLVVKRQPRSQVAELRCTVTGAAYPRSYTLASKRVRYDVYLPR